MADEPPVLGRPSPAAAEAAVLRPAGDARSAAYRADGGDVGWCRVRVASVAGVRHRLGGEPGQDSFGWRLSDSALAIAVADGLGGVPGSGGAAARAAAAAAEAAATDGATAEERVKMALVAAEIAASGGGATTLVVAVLGPDGRGALARVGDSSAFLVEDGGTSWRELFIPPDDEGDLAATAALPSHPDAEFGSLEMRPADVLVLATDGVADPWRDGPTTVAPVLAAAVAAHPSPLELARLASFSRQGCHDDRTMMLCWLPTAIVAGR